MSDSNEISNRSGPGSSAEPSMEEILASIRRILKEDEGSEPAVPDPDDDVLVLDASMMAPVPDISTATEAPPALPPEQVFAAAHQAAPVTTYHEPVHFSAAPEIIAPAPQAAEMSHFVPPVPEMPMSLASAKPEDTSAAPDGLVSSEASAAVASTIGNLLSSISQERNVAVSRGGLTIEDIVREEIKPLLKAWLDAHLPSLVERAVRVEIERVVSRTML